jgi:hypothetical protein
MVEVGGQGARGGRDRRDEPVGVLKGERDLFGARQPDWP